MADGWQIGDLIKNRWQIYKILRGGMGVVYIVYDHEYHNAYAAKTFQDEIFVRSPAVAERFIQEARTWVNLDVHQNIAKAEFLHTIAGKPYLFLEYVSGGDLSGWISTPRLKEDLPQVLRFAIQFCDGMTHALLKGVRAHRDIKPQNCLVTQDNRLKVTDFGLAKVFDDTEWADVEMSNPQGLSVGLSRTGTAAGTCTHMAPEQFEDAKHVDVRADIYSFGVMLYQMVTGKLPFEGRLREELERLHKTRRVPPLGQQLSGLNRIVEQCLAKEPASRYGEFGEVRDGLAKIYEELTGEEAPQPVKGSALTAAQLVNKGASLEALTRPEEALACYDRALEINPHFEVAWNNKGKALDTLERPEDALACFDRALEINPLYAPAWTDKTVVLNALGRIEEALMCNDRALEINPCLPEAWSNKGLALTNLERPEEALDCYERALEINPFLTDALSLKGVILSGLRRLEEALNCFDRALEIDPRHEVTWYNKGVALARLGRSEEALDCFNHAIDLNPHYAKAWISKGAVLGLSDRLRESLTCLEEAYRLGHPQAAQMIKLTRQMLGS